jgi:hypothetical protein
MSPAAETVRCQDCGNAQERPAAYEVRTPDQETFWLCTKCWDRMISAAVFAIARGAF